MPQDCEGLNQGRKLSHCLGEFQSSGLSDLKVPILLNWILKLASTKNGQGVFQGGSSRFFLRRQLLSLFPLNIKSLQPQSPPGQAQGRSIPITGGPEIGAAEGWVVSRSDMTYDPVFSNGQRGGLEGPGKASAGIQAPLGYPQLWVPGGPASEDSQMPRGVFEEKGLEQGQPGTLPMVNLQISKASTSYLGMCMPLFFLKEWQDLRERKYKGSM